MASPASLQSELLRGIKGYPPMLIGLLLWTLILGVRGGQRGMSWLEIPLMTDMNSTGGLEFATANS